MSGTDLDGQDDAGYAEFFGSCWKQVQWAVSMRAADTRFVDDVVQEAFLLARHKWSVLRGYDKPEKWVIKVAWRRLMRIQAKEVGRGHGIEQVVPDPSSVVVEHQQLFAAIGCLTRRRAETIILFVAGFSIADTADFLGISAGAVKKHLFLAKRQLREILQAATDDDGGER